MKYRPAWANIATRVIQTVRRRAFLPPFIAISACRRYASQVGRGWVLKVGRVRIGQEERVWAPGPKRHVRSRNNILTNDWLEVYLMIPAQVPYGVFFNTEAAPHQLLLLSSRLQLLHLPLFVLNMLFPVVGNDFVEIHIVTRRHIDW